MDVDKARNRIGYHLVISSPIPSSMEKEQENDDDLVDFLVKMCSTYRLRLKWHIFHPCTDLEFRFHIFESLVYNSYMFHCCT